MSATWSNTYIRNALVDWITGRSTSVGVNTKPGAIAYAYTGSPPANPDNAYTGTQLFFWSSTLASTWPAASNGAATLRMASALVPTNSASGTIGYIRQMNGSGYPWADFTASLTGGGGSAILNTLTWTSGTAMTYDLTLRMAQVYGTMSFSMQLCNRMIDNLTGVNTTTPAVLTSSTLNVYSGAVPANADAPISGDSVLLATYAIGATSPWAAAVGGAAALTGNIALTAQASGWSGNATATYIRITKGNFVIQGACAATGTPDFMLSTVTLATSQAFNITSATISL